MNPYKLLGVKKKATKPQITAAYRKLSKTHHPDAGGDVEKFRELKEAYDVLVDPARRKRYDETGRTDASRITPERVQHFLAQTFEGVIAANDDIEYKDVQEKLIRSIEGGRDQAELSKKEVQRRVRRTEVLMRRFKRKSSGDSVLHAIMRGKLEVLRGELRNMDDAMELAEEAVNLIKTYKYDVDATPEGPLNAAPTFRSMYGGRSTGSIL